MNMFSVAAVFGLILWISLRSYNTFGRIAWEWCVLCYLGTSTYAAWLLTHRAENGILYSPLQIAPLCVLLAMLYQFCEHLPMQSEKRFLYVETWRLLRVVPAAAMLFFASYASFRAVYLLMAVGPNFDPIFGPMSLSRAEGSIAGLDAVVRPLEKPLLVLSSLFFCICQIGILAKLPIGFWFVRRIREIAPRSEYIFFVKEDNSQSHDRKEFLLKSGFSLEAAIFTLLWLLCARRAFLFIAVCFGYFVLWGLSTFGAEKSIIIYVFSYSLAFGAFAYLLTKRRLIRRGFSLIAEVEARSVFWARRKLRKRGPSRVAVKNDIDAGSLLPEGDGPLPK